MKFNSMYGNHPARNRLDYSRVLEDVYTEVEPYAVDLQTGKVINKSSRPMVVKTGSINVQEKIQSYAQEADIYSILEKFAMSGDTSIINKRVGSFGDIVNIPDNINDFAKYVDDSFKELKKYDKDIAQQIIQNNLSSDEISKMIDERVAASLIKAQEAKKEDNV